MTASVKLLKLFIHFVWCINITRSNSPLGIDSLTFYNHGSVNSSESFEILNLPSNYQEGYMYQDDTNNNNNIKVNSLGWLFKKDANGSYSTPSSGMRSSVPLGSMGGGIFEMRADGRFTDSLMYNNGPGAWPNNNWHKMDINEMMFGVMINTNKTYAKILRTQLATNQEKAANIQHYAIQNLQYEGAYPVSRLSAYDNQWNRYKFHLNLTAFSTFKPHDINMSTTPSVVFVMDLINDGIEDIYIDLLFNFPDQGITFDTISAYNHNGFTINKHGNNISSGNITMSTYQCISSTVCNELNGGYNQYDTLNAMWNSFINTDDQYKREDTVTNTTHYALKHRGIKVSARSVIAVVYVFSYYFPYRTWNNEFIGQYYSNLYKDSEDVNAFVMNRIDEIINNTKKWHGLMYNNSYPDYLKDFYVNTPSYLVRTSMYLKDGRWRQLEAFDCDQIEPPHVGFYRKLPYQLFFTELDQNILETLYMKQMIVSNGIFGEMGMVSENFGGSCGNPGTLQKMDTPNGDPRGDDNPVFILDIYMNWKWAINGDDFMHRSYSYAKKAMFYSMDNAITNKYSLPHQMVNTFDEHGVIGDLNSYNAIIYIVALYAMKEMSVSMNDNDMIHILQNEIVNAKGNLTELLYNEDENHFISFYCANGVYSKHTLQGDTLYGLLWKYIVDIDMDDTLKSIFTSHLQSEHKWNYIPYDNYGVIFNVNMSNYSYHCTYGSSNSGKFTDLDKWDDFTLTSGSLYVYLLNDTASALSYYKTIINKYALLYKDQWDYRILSHFYGMYNKSMIGVDLPGSDISGSPHILSEDDYTLCQSLCSKTEECMAWTYQPPHTYPGCHDEHNIDAQCWLKSSIPSKTSFSCVISGIKGDIPPSRPSCTSHYDRQLIGYSLILALNQQKYDTRNDWYQLKISPLISFTNENECVPLLIPNASSLICVHVKSQCYRIEVLFGTLRLDELFIYDKRIEWNGDMNQTSLLLKQNEGKIVCY